ncbi:hypothetical protein NE237_031465 [Protea cynaroides]|uniref:Uncharacterized protein n=1 Tax=Protea cynaroides TaxID=273540 RepID=A0A9Q0L1B2_9MAGN|nr:hypothetical protein NE237_031465 [Protea cynaroides]
MEQTRFKTGEINPMQSKKNRFKTGEINPKKNKKNIFKTGEINRKQEKQIQKRIDSKEKKPQNSNKIRLYKPNGPQTNMNQINGKLNQKITKTYTSETTQV